MIKDIDNSPFSYHVNRKYKDGLFRLLFSEKEGALELYNALNGSSYEDPEMLEITTIDDVIYMGMKNDLSFLVEGKMHLLEEQSSWSENMPLRELFYFSNLYQSYVETNQLNIYSRKRLPLPQPLYIVFYIGTDEMPEQMILRLSESFETNGSEPTVEMMARVLNVNYGKNRELLDRCQRLYGYADTPGSFLHGSGLGPGSRYESSHRRLYRTRYLKTVPFETSRGGNRRDSNAGKSQGVDGTI